MMYRTVAIYNDGDKTVTEFQDNMNEATKRYEDYLWSVADTGSTCNLYCVLLCAGCEVIRGTYFGED